MTNKQQSVFFLLIVFLFATGAGLLVYKNYNDYFQQKTEIDLESASVPMVVPKPAVVSKPKPSIVLADGRLQVDSPKQGDTVGNTFTISGYAQGWLEGNIAIKVLDDSNQLLYQGSAIAGNNYQHPAPFTLSVTLAATSTTQTGRIEFNDYSAKDGSLVYQKEVNITFSDYPVAGWKTYKNDRYGFEFEYPSNLGYIPVETMLSAKEFQVNIELPAPAVMGESHDPTASIFEVQVIRSSLQPHEWLSDSLKSDFLNEYLNKITDFIFLNKTASKVLVADTSSTFYETIGVSVGSQLYIINSNQEYTPIISTFKFSN